MAETKCIHGLEISNEETNTYCASCVYEALYDESLGIDMGLHPKIKQQIRNKEKVKRRRERLHG